MNETAPAPLLGTPDHAPCAPIVRPAFAGPVTIWTGSTCAPNPGPGGWAAILRNANGKEHRLSGGMALDASNYLMDLMGPLHALRFLTRPSIVTVHVGCETVALNMQHRLPDLQARGWRKANGRAVAHADVMRDLADLCGVHQVTWCFTPGGCPSGMHVKADDLAARARLKALREWWNGEDDVPGSPMLRGAC